MSKPISAAIGKDQASNMNLDEARKVMWLRNNYRPFGELFDEGYLNQARLEWASQKAYDPKLREAAKVLLNFLKQLKSEPLTEKDKSSELSDKLLPIPLTIEQARQTIWPLKPYIGQPMGPLVDSRQITLKDLGYAVENAWETRVRKASVALMLHRLNQVIKETPPPAGFLHVIAGGRSYSERRQLQITLIEGLVSGAVITSAIFFAILSEQARRQATPSKTISEMLSTPTGIISVIIALAIIIGLVFLILFFFNSLTNRFEKQKDNYRTGQLGEDQVIEVIRQSLDGSWYVFRNVVLPGRKKSDLDAVVIGPPGLWVLEIKTFTGEYRNIGEQWEYRGGNRWLLYSASPSRQAQNNAIRLSNFLKADDIKQWVSPAVVWANQESKLTVENPATAVWSIDRLPEELGNVWYEETISEDKRKQIIEKLTKLCKDREN